MAVFQTDEQLYAVLGGFFEALAQNPDVGQKLLDSKLRIKFNYTEPQAALGVDLTGAEVIVLQGATDFKPDVEMSMKADTAHKFWQGQVNLVVALARREITAKGPIPKILKLLPIIKPAYELYPSYLQKIGFAS